MSIFTKIIISDDKRPTRFHTQNGQLIDLRGWLELPMTGLTYAVYKSFGYRPSLPWWTLSAIQFVRGNLVPQDCVLEDGSGMSTLWLARRCTRVVSVEQSAEWFREVESRAYADRSENIELVHGEALPAFVTAAQEGLFTVIVIDGLGNRLQLLKVALSGKKLPRMIIYDNSDREQDQEGEALARKAGYDVYAFRGFAPTMVAATQTSVFCLPE